MRVRGELARQDMEVVDEEKTPSPLMLREDAPGVAAGKSKRTPLGKTWAMLSDRTLAHLLLFFSLALSFKFLK